MEEKLDSIDSHLANMESNTDYLYDMKEELKQLNKTMHLILNELRSINTEIADLNAKS